MLARPVAVARLASGSESVPDTRIVRVLGGRQLLQGVVLMIRPKPALVAGAVVIDALHATSMVVAALIWPGYRRAALASATIAGTSAVAGAVILRGALR